MQSSNHLLIAMPIFVLSHVVKWFANDKGWPVRIVRCKEADEGKSLEERQFPVFAFIATKFKKVNEMIPVSQKK